MWRPATRIGHRGRLRALAITALVLGAALLSLIFVTVVALPIYFGTDSGHARVARWLERKISSAIPGRVEIGQIDSLKPSSVQIFDLVIRDAGDTPVLRVAHVTVDLDLHSALHGELAFDHARVDGGFLLIAVQADGRTSLEAAFSSRSKQPADPEHGVQLNLRAIDVHGLQLLLQPSKDQVFRLRDVNALVRIWREHTPGVRVDMTNVRATVTDPQLLGSTISITRADGWVHGAETHVLQLSFATQLGHSGALDGKLDYFSRKQTPVVVELEPKGNLKTQLAADAILVRSWFTSVVDVRLR